MIDFIQHLGALILSLISIIGCVVTYVIHDRKLKCQEKRLNALQIMQIEKQEAREKMADIKSLAFSIKRGCSAIRFCNTGTSDAKNVRVMILTPEEELRGIIFPKKQWGPYELINSQGSCEEIINLCMGHPKFLKIKVVWDDDYQDNRSSILNVQI